MTWFLSWFTMWHQQQQQKRSRDLIAASVRQWEAERPKPTPVRDFNTDLMEIMAASGGWRTPSATDYTMKPLEIKMDTMWGL